MGRKRKTKVAVNKGWEDLRKNLHYTNTKTWKLNPNCPEEMRKQVNKIEYLKRLEAEKDE